MYMDIDTKLSEMIDGLVNKLRKYGAIDDTCKIIDKKKFDKLIEITISNCESLLPLVEKNGTVFNKYGFDLILSRIRILQDMQMRQSVYPYRIESAAPAQQPIIKKTNIFQQIRIKILGRTGQTR